ncbi:glycosyl hydrolase family 65 protein [Modestobacter muralis]|uniref:glycosyl hydrolase family 65 protein n=1 Tax=Modestobacter muralis TaxID=1608614 RepID=UPI001B8AC577
MIFASEVVVDTSAIRAAAWQELFAAVLTGSGAGAATVAQPSGTAADGRRYLDQRSPEAVVIAFLSDNHMTMPMGHPDDPPGTRSVNGLAAHHDQMYLRLLTERPPRVSPGAIDLLRRLRAGHVPTGLVVGREHSVLAALPELQGLLDVVVGHAPVDGPRMSHEPAPALFLDVAQRLEVPPAGVAVVEGTAAGVRAARAAHVGLVVGISRAGHRRDLEAAGAQLVVDDLGELDLGVLRTDPWLLVYEGFDPAHEGHREALTTLGNGYAGTRGAAPESSADGTHYPGTYLAGIYNRLTSTVQGRQVEDEHLVNVHNWLPLDVRIEDGGWWSDGGLTERSERRELDLRRGLLTRHVQLTDRAGRRLQLTQRRLVSMEHPHLAALETTLLALGWSGQVSVRSGIDAGITNSNVAEYAALADRHLDRVTVQQPDPETLLVQAATTQSRITVSTAARTVVHGASVPTPRRLESGPEGRHAHRVEVGLRDGLPVVIDKTVAMATSRDRAIAAPGLGTLDELARAPAGVSGLLPGHVAAWQRLWDRFGVTLDSDRETQLVLNLHVFHQLQTISPHTAELDVGVPARGLHGEGYRGHVFWDELFVLPSITTHLPEVSRALLDYRWRRLPAARQAAAHAGLSGALFPWQSGSDGREETPAQLFNARSQRWMPDNSRRQRHVSLAVAYNAWQYYQGTGDRTWLADRGAELIIDVARLFVSLGTHDPATDRYHIAGVMGPDEYHDGYPDAPGEGLRDNAYTNVLAAWICQRAGEVLTVLAGHDREEVVARLRIRPGEPATWARLSHRLGVPFLADGVISQFDGYDALAELDWDRYEQTYGNIGRLDLILEAEGDTTNRYRLAKQADVLMLIYLLGPDELLAVLNRLGYPATTDTLVRTIDFYLARTAHGSTLSRVVHASVLARIDPTRAWSTFREALVADLDDTQGGTTEEGIHLGAMAGTVDIVTRAFAGMQIHGGTVAFAPRLPAELRSARFQIQYRGQRLDVILHHDRLLVTARECAAAAPVRIDVAGATFSLGAGQAHEFWLGGVPREPERPAGSVQERVGLGLPTGPAVRQGRA